MNRTVERRDCSDLVIPFPQPGRRRYFQAKRWGNADGRYGQLEF